MSPPLSALILAGGQSSRMGRDKALISVGGIPLLRQVYGVARQCTPLTYIVTPWPDRYRSILPEPALFIREVPLPGKTQSIGPLGGFAQGLAQIETGWVLLLACDLPNLKAQVLQGWQDSLTAVPEGAIACLPRHPKGWEPLCGFYRRDCLSALTAFIQQGGRSFQTWLSSQVVLELPLGDPSMLLNCNTPDDFGNLDL